MTLPEFIDDARTWAASWSGRLALIAASLTGVLAADPTVAIVATELIPDGPVRVGAIIALISITYLLPLFATKKDAKDGTLPDA